MAHLLPLLRVALALLPLLLAGRTATACTAFVTTHNGRTFIGNNEDAWSITARVRFEQGRDGGYGAVYFGHFNGHPFRGMVDQIGMNEAGLVVDGLAIQPKHVAGVPGKKQVPFDALMPLLMRTCSDVNEVAALLRTTDNSWLTQSMLFIADRHGGYLIVENDTIVEGHGPWYAVGNWRMSSCSDPSTIPIPRLQEGRALLATGTGGSLEEARDVLARMAVCRRKMGEGTLFSTLFDPVEGRAHLYFYHDFSEAVTFDLHAELAKGDRTVAMASLFGVRPEFERLKAYITPFHQRWLFWGLVGLLVLTGIAGLWSLVVFVRSLFKRSERRGTTIMQALLAGMGCTLIIALLGVLLMQEGVYYFGLGDVSPLLAWLPIALALLLIALLIIRRKDRHKRVLPAGLGAAIMLPLLLLLTYWGMWWP